MEKLNFNFENWCIKPELVHEDYFHSKEDGTTYQTLIYHYPWNPKEAESNNYYQDAYDACLGKLRSLIQNTILRIFGESKFYKDQEFHWESEKRYLTEHYFLVNEDYDYQNLMGLNSYSDQIFSSFDYTYTDSMLYITIKDFAQ